MAQTTTSEIFIIKWNNTGEVLSRVDSYDWTEKAEGVDQFGNDWQGYAIMSCDEIIEIEEPEMIKL
jgi:hypothetical protein